jgi:hypothetical protein
MFVLLTKIQAQKLRHFSRSALRSLKLLTTAKTLTVSKSQIANKFSRLQETGGDQVT